MATSEHADKPAVETQGLEDFEFVTLTGHQYVCVHLDEGGWKHERGFLERRQRQEPVPVDRRRESGAA